MSVGDSVPYRSPVSKLLPFFRKSRNKWKDKCKAAEMRDLGIRQSAWDAQNRVLSHEDVELIDLDPVTESNGKVVYRQLKAASAKTGVPRAIISDQGSDLHSGIERF